MQKTWYTFTFDEGNIHWRRSRKENTFYLKLTENYVNDCLRYGKFKDSKHRGYLFLNDVLDVLGFPRVKTGYRLGWIFGGNGDNVIDFGINYRGTHPNVIITFNVDGDIFNEVFGIDSE